jgi:flagellar hook-associated protein 3 FlgL
MAISGIGNPIPPNIQQILNIRRQLDDLQRQLGTGQKADLYSGLGPQSGLSVGLNAQLSAISAFNDSIAYVNTRLGVAQTALSQIASTVATVKGSTVQPGFSIDSTGQTTVQKNARDQLDQILALLNSKAGDRYLFSGTGVNQPATETTDHILDGNGTRAGLRQVVTERNQADLGTNGLGRLTIPAPTATAATLAGSGATLSADAPATGTGTVTPLTGATTLASLGIANGDVITVGDGTNSTNYTVQPGDDINDLITGLSNQPGGADVTVSLQGGALQVQANNNVATVTVSDNVAGGDLTALGFALGNQTFAPTNLLTQGAVSAGQTLSVTIGGNPPLTVTFGTGPGQVADLAGLNAALATIPVGIGTASVGPTGNLTVNAVSSSDVITVGGTANPARFGLSTATAAPGGGATIAEEAPATVFGFKLAGVSSQLTGATATGPSGSPATIAVNLTGNPNSGEKIRFTFNLPDGTTEDLTLTATTTTPPGAGQFTIGATPAATAANLQAVLTTEVDKLADTALSAASAVAAANDFFNTGVGNPPRRVDGPTPATATGLVAGTTANTVFWYTGEDGPVPTRETASAMVDPSITVNYGLRANEEGIRFLLQNVAVLAATKYQQSDTNAPASYAALSQRLNTALSVPAGTQKIDDIEASLASAQTAMSAAKDRHAQTQNTLTDMLQQIEGVTPEEVGSKLLALQTSLQATLQTTAKLAQISLVNYL